MNILLAAFPSNADKGRFIADTMPPLSLYTLAAVLREKYDNIIILDPNYFCGISIGDFEQCFLDFIANKNIGIIGFSSNTFNWALSRIAINCVKNSDKYSSIITIAGGLHPSYFDEFIMSTTQVDYILRGDGERSLLELIDYIYFRQGCLSDISGLTFRVQDKIIRNEYRLQSAEELELAPFPAYDLLPSNSYDSISVEASRGCQFSCAFCSIQYRHKWRGLSVKNIMNRVDYAKTNIHKYNSRNFINFADDCFTADPYRAETIISSLSKMKDGFQYFIEARISDLMKNGLVDKIDPDIIMQMQIGVECGYDEGLQKIHKGTTISQLFSCLQRMKATGLNKKVFLSFIIGFPWETESEINDTLATIRKIATEYETTCNINWLLLLPSEIWTKRQEYGIFLSEELFDRFLWHAYPEYFYSAHPKISEKAFRSINKNIIRLKAESDYIKYNVPIFLKNNMIFE